MKNKVLLAQPKGWLATYKTFLTTRAGISFNDIVEAPGEFKDAQRLVAKVKAMRGQLAAVLFSEELAQQVVPAVKEAGALSIVATVDSADLEARERVLKTLDPGVILFNQNPLTQAYRDVRSAEEQGRRIREALKRFSSA